MSPQLSEKDRARLDGIVQQMVANGEPDEAIHAVVGDFKQKYGGLQGGGGQAPGPHAAEAIGFGMQRSPTPQELGRELWEQGIKGPVQSFINDPVGTAASAAGGALAAIKPGFDPIPGGDLKVGLTEPTQAMAAREIAHRGPAATAASTILGTAPLAAKGTSALAREAGSSIPGVSRVSEIRANGPRVRVLRSLRPTASDSGFGDRIDQTISQIKKANGGAIPRTVEEAIPQVERGISKGNEALEPYFQRAEAAGVQAPGDSILGATHKAISESMTPSEIQAKGQGIMERAQMDYGRSFTPRELKQRLELLNARLSGYYDQSIAKQIAALSDVPDAVVKAQRDATADLLYHTLAPEEAGAGPRYIQQHIGDMIDLKGALQRAKNRSIGEQPASMWEATKRAVPNPIGAATRQALRNNPTTATEEAFSGRTNVDLKKAFKEVKDEANTYPQPVSSDYQFHANPAPEGTPQLPAGKAPFTQGTSVPDITGQVKEAGKQTVVGPRRLPPGVTESGSGAIWTRPIDTPPLLEVGKPDVGQGVRTVPPPGATESVPHTSTGEVPTPRAKRGMGLTQTGPKPPDITPASPVAPPDTSSIRAVPGKLNYGESMENANKALPPPAPNPAKKGLLNEPPPVQPPDAQDMVFDPESGTWIPKYAKGGIIDHPQRALIGEAGPEARIQLTASHPTIPEKDGTIEAQLNQLSTGKRRVVMIPKGTNMPKTPKGMKRYSDGTGNNYIYHPDLTSHREIDQAVFSNSLPSLLGAKDGGMGAPDKSELGPDPKAVVAEDKKGREVQSTATDSQHLGQTIKQTEKLTPKDGKLSVKSPMEALDKRRSPQTPQDLGNVEPVDKAVDKIRGSINVPLDEQGEKEADELGRNFAAKGGLNRIISSPLLRAKQTAAGMIKHNPGAKMTTTPNLRPWPLGALEGTPTEEALPELKRLALQTPAEVPPGIGQGSTERGQSFHRFQRRVISEVLRQYDEHERTAPDENWDLGAHKSIINLVHAWSKAGAKPDLSIDRDHFFANGSDPASVYQILDRGKTIRELNMKDKGKLKGAFTISRHGSTSFNAPSSAARPGKSVS